MNKKQVVCSAFIILLMIGAFLLSYKWYCTYHFQDKTDVPLIEASITEEVKSTEIPIVDGIQEEQLPVTNLAEALEVNGDTVAWITIPNSYINEPVLQTNNNLKYLRQDIYGQTGTGGSIFADYECDFNSHPTSQNLILYGHSWSYSHNKGFSQLRSYLEKDGMFFVNHPFIDVELIDGTLLEYQVVSAGVTDATQDGVCIVADPSVEQLEQIEALTKERNVLDTNFTLTKDTQFLTLSTCTGKDEERLLIVAILKTEL